MSELLTNIIAFIVALSVLVAVHEFGHFWVARRLGVKVLRFSIGFGKVLWSYQKTVDSTEFAISAIPLGGYVKMLDEREGEVPVALREHAFNNQSLWRRVAIVLAGPLFNLVLAAAIYALIFVIGINGLKPVVDKPGKDTPAAQAGFLDKDTVTRVAGQQVRIWQDMHMAVLNTALEQNDIEFEVTTADGQRQLRHMVLHDTQLLNDEGDILGKLGLTLWQPLIPAIIHEVMQATPAEKAGLQAGDHILSVDDKPVKDWIEWAEYVRARAGQTIQVGISRQGQSIVLPITPGLRQEGGGSRGFVGAVVKAPEDVALIVTVNYPVLESIQRGVVKAKDIIMLTFKMLGKLVVGDASLKNISGPISMAEYAGKTARIDLSYFLDFLALVSVSLGVLNLLPIPLLDGGLLFFYLIEAFKGRPLSERMQMLGQQIGILMLGCLMMLAFYNDIVRLWGR